LATGAVKSSQNGAVAQCGNPAFGLTRSRTDTAQQHPSHQAPTKHRLASAFGEAASRNYRPTR